jgi:tRNA pseudouridine32 synthase / 23S rRNA pseudouridine746 synthase
MVYYYEGNCPRSGELLRLPRSPDSEELARGLIRELSQQPPRAGKMYGVLVAHNRDGQIQVVKAFSGLLDGCAEVNGWVPPIPGRQQVAAIEVLTLEQLTAIKKNILQLQQLPARRQYAALLAEYTELRRELQAQLKINRQARQRQRQELVVSSIGADLVELTLAELVTASQQDGLRQRRLKQQWDAIFQPLQTLIGQADRQIQDLKAKRKALSQQLQAHMHQAAALTNFAGESISLAQLQPAGLPTGSGECCAPKLLHYAATHNLQPIAMAEFWWGTAVGDKQPGEFYGACVDRCQPLMGFMLSGLSAQVRASSHRSALAVIYSDDFLLIVHKPSGLLSVPGRYGQENALDILKSEHAIALWAAHRLDQDTSGILVLAKNLDTYRAMSKQFANSSSCIANDDRTLHKVYEALVVGKVQELAGSIDLPLAADLIDRPQQKVDWLQGNPSVTQYRVMEIVGNQTRLELRPLTGRTHQLRVHAAQGLGTAIMGDRLYGQDNSERLCLHAREISFVHPHSLDRLYFQIPTPF